MNKLDVAIALIKDAKDQVNKPFYREVQFQKYQDDLKLARRMILDMYPDNAYGRFDSDVAQRLYKELSGHEV